MKGKFCPIFLLSVTVFLGAATTAVAATTSDDATLSGLPLVFEPNLRQTDSSVRFLSRGPSYTVLLTDDRAILKLPGNPSSSYSQEQTVSLQLLHARKEANPEGRNLLPGRSNYYIGRRSKDWLTNIPQYGQIVYPSISPGVDVVYYGNDGQLECDFVVEPGTDASALGFRVTGAAKLELTSSGNLMLKLASGNVEFKQPVIYQEDQKGIRESVTGRYILRANNEVGFDLGPYDHAKKLVVDPSLSYSTLIGANGNTQIQGLAVDGNGSAIVTGTTFATDYPTVNPSQPGSAGYTDVFVTKLSSNGQSILYSTYIGGTSFDSGRAIAVDNQGNAYITGNIGSGDFPTTPGAFMQECPNICNTPFVAKFLPDGKLAYSTYTGGSNVASWAIAVDLAGSAFITGSAASDDIPMVNPFQSTFAGGFVQKLSPDGSALVYSTYLGGGTEWARGITVDAAGSAYVVGSTSSSFPLKNPIQSSIVGGPNAFITKFSPDGSALVFSTYLGGSSPFFFQSGGDYASGVAVDPSGVVHVTGTTSSCEFPLTIYAFSTECVTLGYDQKQFVLSLDPTGTHILFSTLLRSGFSGGIAADKDGNSFVTGTTSANNFPILHPLESTSQQSQSIGFVTEFDRKGNIVFSTYFGATSGGAQPAGIALDSNSNIYIAGGGQGDFPLLNPIPSQAHPTTFYLSFISKISPKKTPQISLSPRSTGLLSLRNMSSVPMTISSITTSPNLTQGGDCGSSLGPGTGCNLILQNTDNPPRVGTVTVVSNATKSPKVFSIVPGSGFLPGLSIFPMYLQFAPQLSGTTSPQQRVVIKNAGLEPTAINSIFFVQQSVFHQSNDCPAMLSPGGSCTVLINYSPGSTQEDSDQLAIIHDPFESRDTVFVGGKGSASAIVASTPDIEFGSQFVGAAPLARIVNLTNATPYPASVAGLSPSSGFSQSNTCAAPLAPQASCRVAVRYWPKSNESVTGTLKVASFGPGGTQTLNLYGSGVIPSELTVSPVPLNLYSLQGRFAGTGDVTVTNTSSKVITLGAATIPSPFSSQRNCAATLAPGVSCTITVTFTPTQPGIAQGTLQIQHSGMGSPQLVPIIGTAQTVLTVQPSPLDFGQQPRGQQTIGYVGLGNGTGYPAVTVTSITVEGTDFALVKNGCPSTFPPFFGCGDLQISFNPSHTGLRTGKLIVVANDVPQPHVITLQGFGISAGQATLSAESLDFGARSVGTQSNPMTVQITNTGTGSLGIASITSSPAFFPETSNCPATLAKGTSCTISVRFAPTLQGILEGTITIKDNAAGNPHKVVLRGIAQ